VTKPLAGIFAFLLLALTTQFLRQLCGLMHVPDIISLIREPLLLLLFWWALLHLNFFKESRLVLSLVGLATLFSVYIMVAAFEGRLFAGLYYVRIYMIPVLFFVACHAALRNASREQLLRALHVHACLNLVLLGIAFGVFALLQAEPRWRGLLVGDGTLATAWFISGGVYMRMGLPFISPNNLGSYAALAAVLSSLVLFAMQVKPGERRLHWASMLFSLAALAASLSRSAMLLLFFALVCYLTIPAFYHSRLFGRLLGLALVLVVLVALGMLVVEFISDGYVSRWIALNLAGKDPSLQGHIETFVEAYRNVEQYFLHGYPHGTVGPKAFQFSARIHNAENSLLAVAYDFGLIAGAAFLSLQLLLLSSAWYSRLQFPVLLGFLVNMQFLPIIFEPESIAWFVFVYLLAGHLARAGLFDHLSHTAARRYSGSPVMTSGPMPQRG
jgi:hypothetical protein